VEGEYAASGDAPQALLLSHQHQRERGNAGSSVTATTNSSSVTLTKPSSVTSTGSGQRHQQYNDSFHDVFDTRIRYTSAMLP
jgi:hypothetical protein